MLFLRNSWRLNTGRSEHLRADVIPGDPGQPTISQRRNADLDDRVYFTAWTLRPEICPLQARHHRLFGGDRRSLHSQNQRLLDAELRLPKASITTRDGYKPYVRQRLMTRTAKQSRRPAI